MKYTADDVRNANLVAHTDAEAEIEEEAFKKAAKAFIVLAKNCQVKLEEEEE